MLRTPLLFLLAACARRFPAEPLPPSAPVLAAPDYATDLLASGSAFQAEVVANLRRGAAADGILVDADERLSRVAERIAWERATSGQVPPPGLLQDLVSDSGSPYVIGTLAVEVLPRRRPIATDLYATRGLSVPGGPLPLVVGVGAWEQGDETILVLVLARRGFRLEGTVPREGATTVPLVPTADVGPIALVAVDAAGEHRSVGVPDADGAMAPAVPVTDGQVELMAGERSLGVMRLGTPPPVPGPSGGGLATLSADIAALRMAWGLAPVPLAAGVPDCTVVSDVLDGVELTRAQRCTSVPADGWDTLVRRPAVLRVMADPEADFLQIGVDLEAGRVTLRSLRRFERWTSEEATERVAAAIEARWPGVRRDPGSPFPELARGWAEGADPALAEGALGVRADTVTARWAGEGRGTRILGATQDLSRLLDAAPETQSVSYGVGVVLGKGPNGEPVYYGAVGFRN